MMGHVLSVAAGATGQRSQSVLGPVVEVFNQKQELAPIQCMCFNRCRPKDMFILTFFYCIDKSSA